MLMKLTRANVLRRALRRPLKSLRWEDLRGTMKEFSMADVVTVHENGKVKVMKDRQGMYLNIARDADGLVDESRL